MTEKTASPMAVSGVSSRLFRVLALATALGLAGCSDVDTMLFGSDDSATDQTQTANGESSGAQAPTSAGTPTAAMPEAAGETAPTATASLITPVTIEQGSDTGTAVSKSVAELRGKLSLLESSLGQNAQRLAELRSGGAEAATAYHESKARITARLQMGTTRGNPELVAEWNNAQSALDRLSASINSLNALGTSVGNDASTAHYTLDQIAATFNVSGAVDEDHRQLSVLEDETNQTIILIDSLLRDVSDNVQRQTAYVANERANLTTLASAIKNGELYGSDLGTPMLAATSAGLGGTNFAYGGPPLVVIRFDHPDVDYQQILYAALSQALHNRPGAGFAVVAVSPTRGTAVSVQLAQTSAERHAQEVMRTMTDMGVPASRLMAASATDPAATSSEVRVFVR
jgi:hypothetical protein